MRKGLGFGNFSAEYAYRCAVDLVRFFPPFDGVQDGVTHGQPRQAFGLWPVADDVKTNHDSAQVKSI